MSLNARQRKIIGVGIVVIVAMGIFPPYDNCCYDGYDFIGFLSTYEIDMTRLFIQWGLVTLVSGAGVLLTSQPKKGDGAHGSDSSKQA
ncbi:MAG: hypothetical protein EXR54_09430 [Dehalococcoidia bacterium]|nr:hypothetical protein [Dehalococcoidia bacterium]